MSAFKDLTGQTFGRLKVLRRVENKFTAPSCPQGRVQYECQCSCPKHTKLVVLAGSLRSGNTVSCGCYQKERISETHLKDLTGKTFGRLTVLGRVPSDRGGVYWRCRCSCDDHNETIVTASHLLSGHTTSCGCMKILAPQIANTKWTDEERDIIKHLDDMIQRCHNPHDKYYSNYGERGIYVCDEWRDSVNGKQAFIDWSKSHGYRKDLSIDRFPDNDGPYAPWNCRWATREEQNNNTRKNIFVEVKGYRRTLAQWARFLCCKYWKLQRLNALYGKDAVIRYISQYVADKPN